MADTVRTLAQIQTLLADNAVGAISPQDLRDMLVSLRTIYASCYVSSAVATVFASNSAFAKALGTTTSVDLSTEFTMPANNRLQYNGPVARRVVVRAVMSMVSAANNQTVNAAIYHYDASGASGAVVASSTQAHKIVTGTDVGQAMVTGVITLDTSDYVEVHLKNTNWTGAGDTVTLNYLFFDCLSVMA